MAPPNLYEFLLFIVVGGGGYFARQLLQDIKQLAAELAAHKVEVARNYATNSDLARIDQKLDKILDKLELKADR